MRSSCHRGDSTSPNPEASTETERVAMTPTVGGCPDIARFGRKRRSAKASRRFGTRTGPEQDLWPLRYLAAWPTLDEKAQGSPGAKQNGNHDDCTTDQPDDFAALS